jgi:hypothetical protein
MCDHPPFIAIRNVDPIGHELDNEEKGGNCDDRER